MNILIGKHYQTEFESIFKMLESRCPAFEGLNITTWGSFSRNSAGASITDGGEGLTFFYAPYLQNAQYENSADGGNDNPFGFTATGASWFARLRGEQANVSADTRWETFMSKISALYHQRYAIVEYQKPNRKQIDEDDAKQLATRALNLLWPNHLALNAQTFKDVSGDRASGDVMDIYVLSLRLLLSYGSAEPIRILGNAYLKKRDRSEETDALLCEEAAAINSIFKSMTPEATKGAERAGDEETRQNNAAALRNRACDELQKLINKNQECLTSRQTDEDHNFMNYLFLAEEEKQIIRDLLQKTAHDNTRLECRQIELLGISHVRWDNTVFEYCENDVPKLRFIFSLNKSLTVKCANCGESIVKNNNFLLQTYTDDEDAEVQYTEKSIFDGLSEQEVVQMRDQIHAQHLIEIENCGNFDGSEPCHRLRCASQCFEADNGRLYCKDCGRPEIVCFDEAFEPFPTAEARFSVTELKMIHRQKASYCPVCNRYTTDHEQEGGIEYCPLCKQAIKFATSDSRADEKSAKCYRRYAHAVPLFSRMRVTRKAAFEDAGMVLLVIGKQIFKLDKLFSRTASILPSAKRIKY